MIRLKNLLEAEATSGENPPAATPPAQPTLPPPPAQPAPEQKPTISGQDSPTEYSPSFDFNDFQSKLAQSTETAKNNFQNKLLQKVNGKKVIIRASKGQPGQPLKDYTINVNGASVDYYYDKYVVILRDEKDKEYFLDTMMKIKILGSAEAAIPKDTKSIQSTKPQVAPVEKTPNTATQGI